MNFLLCLKLTVHNFSSIIFFKFIIDTPLESKHDSVAVEYTPEMDRRSGVATVRPCLTSLPGECLSLYRAGVPHLEAMVPRGAMGYLLGERGVGGGDMERCEIYDVELRHQACKK